MKLGLQSAFVFLAVAVAADLEGATTTAAAALAGPGGGRRADTTG
jgi:hypothetical protein